RGRVGRGRADPVHLAARGRRAPDRAGAPSRAGARPGAGGLVRRPVRPRALLQRLPRGSDHLARARRRRRLAVLAGGPALAGRAVARPSGRMRGERLSPAGAWVVIGTLFALVAITLPELG